MDNKEEVLTFKEAIALLEGYKQQAAEYGKALRELRGAGNWEEEIEKDRRISVQTIYSLYKQVLNNIKEIESYYVYPSR